MDNSESKNLELQNEIALCPGAPSPDMLHAPQMLLLPNSEQYQPQQRGNRKERRGDPFLFPSPHQAPTDPGALREQS